MKRVKFLLVILTILSCITTNAQQTHIRIISGDEMGMAYVQGYEYDGGQRWMSTADEPNLQDT